jgi:hypothetical protein
MEEDIEGVEERGRNGERIPLAVSSSLLCPFDVLLHSLLNICCDSWMKIFSGVEGI